MSPKEPTQVSASERIQNAYKQLNSAAAELNSASDELKEAMSVVDAALQRLNLGISVWVEISGNEDGQGEWWDRRIGYSKIGKEWCIGLDSRRGHYAFPEDDYVEEWPFNEAPRWMRIEAIKKIPDLLEALVKESRETTSKLKKRTEQVLELSVAMRKTLDEMESEKKAGSNA